MWSPPALGGEAVAQGGAEGGLCLAWGAHTYLCGDTILKHGTEEQERKYIPKIASGEWVGAMGLTEPERDPTPSRWAPRRFGRGIHIPSTAPRCSSPTGRSPT